MQFSLSPESCSEESSCHHVVISTDRASCVLGKAEKKKKNAFSQVVHAALGCIFCLCCPNSIMCTQQIYFYSFSWPMDTGCLPSLSSVDRYVAFLPSLSCVLLQCYLAFKRMQCASQQPASLSSFMNDCIFQGYIFQLRLSLMFISCSGISLQGSRDFLPALTCRVVHFFFSCGIRVHLYTENFMFSKTFFCFVQC